MRERMVENGTWNTNYFSSAGESEVVSVNKELSSPSVSWMKSRPFSTRPFSLLCASATNPRESFVGSWQRNCKATEWLDFGVHLQSLFSSLSPKTKSKNPRSDSTKLQAGSQSCSNCFIWDCYDCAAQPEKYPHHRNKAVNFKAYMVGLQNLSRKVWLWCILEAGGKRRRSKTNIN